nr:ribonuclease HII [Bifidobacterium aemilianum]
MAAHSLSVPNLDFERELASQGHELILGFDEVGRGALAGPVMVGVAALWAKDLPQVMVPAGVADSKLLTEHRREAMFQELCAWPAAHAVGQASNVEIDEWGMTYALGIAALRAIKDLEAQLGLGEGPGSLGSPVSAAGPGRICGILDGPYDYISKACDTFDAPSLSQPLVVRTRVKADRSCALVSVASVIAKVTRDRLMVSIAQGNDAYRPYQWVRNKGYGTKDHREAIMEYGPTPLHRTSWHLT